MSVREVDTHVGLELMQRRELDIALIRQLSVPRGFQRAVLKQESFVLAAPADWKLPRTLSRDLALAAELPWIWIPRTRTPDYHDQVAACCRAAGFTPHAQHLAQSINSQLAMVASGLGVALVPESSLDGHLSGRRIKAVRLRTSSTIDLAAVWRPADNRLVGDLLEGDQALVERLGGRRPRSSGRRTVKRLSPLAAGSSGAHEREARLDERECLGHGDLVRHVGEVGEGWRGCRRAPRASDARDPARLRADQIERAGVADRGVADVLEALSVGIAETPGGQRRQLVSPRSRTPPLADSSVCGERPAGSCSRGPNSISRGFFCLTTSKCPFLNRASASPRAFSSLSHARCHPSSSGMSAPARPPAHRARRREHEHLPGVLLEDEHAPGRVGRYRLPLRTLVRP